MQSRESILKKYPTKIELIDLPSACLMYHQRILTHSLQMIKLVSCSWPRGGKLYVGLLKNPAASVEAGQEKTMLLACY